MKLHIITSSIDIAKIPDNITARIFLNLQVNIMYQSKNSYILEQISNKLNSCTDKRIRNTCAAGRDLMRAKSPSSLCTMPLEVLVACTRQYPVVVCWELNSCHSTSVCCKQPTIVLSVLNKRMCKDMRVSPGTVTFFRHRLQKQVRHSLVLRLWWEDIKSKFRYNYATYQQI